MTAESPTHSAFNFWLFGKVLKLRFRQGELASLYGRSRQSIWAWSRYAETKGQQGSMPVDPVLCDRYNGTSQKILDYVERTPLPALDSPARQAYVNELVASLKNP